MDFSFIYQVLIQALQTRLWVFGSTDAYGFILAPSCTSSVELAILQEILPPIIDGKRNPFNWSYQRSKFEWEKSVLHNHFDRQRSRMQ